MFIDQEEYLELLDRVARAEERVAELEQEREQEHRRLVALHQNYHLPRYVTYRRLA